MIITVHYIRRSKYLHHLPLCGALAQRPTCRRRYEHFPYPLPLCLCLYLWWLFVSSISSSCAKRVCWEITVRSRAKIYDFYLSIPELFFRVFPPHLWTIRYFSFRNNYVIHLRQLEKSTTNLAKLNFIKYQHNRDTKAVQTFHHKLISILLLTAFMDILDKKFQPLRINNAIWNIEERNSNHDNFEIDSFPHLGRIWARYFLRKLPLPKIFC